MSEKNEEMLAINFYCCILSSKLSMSGRFEQTVTEMALYCPVNGTSVFLSI